MTYSIVKDKHLDWIVDVAAIKMLTDEVKRPECINKERIEFLVATSHNLVVEKEGIPVGALTFVVTENLYNPSLKVAAELFWYVLPEYRGTRAGYLLLKEYVRLSEEMADEAAMSLLSSSPIKGLEKLGFNNTEQAYNKIFRK